MKKHNEEKLRNKALFNAIMRMHEEKGLGQPLELDCGLRVDSFTIMDEYFLERLVELAEQEYQKLLSIN